jgi:phage-related holin
MKDKILSICMKVISVSWVYVTPVHDVIIGISVLVAFDFITGIMAAKKLKKKITSSGFRQTISKTLVYQSAVIVSMVLEKYLIPGMPVIKIISSLIAITETKSFFENVEVLTGINFWDKLSSKVLYLFEKRSKK